MDGWMDGWMDDGWVDGWVGVIGVSYNFAPSKKFLIFVSAWHAAKRNEDFPLRGTYHTR
jgi:hypothetical protein